MEVDALFELRREAQLQLVDDWILSFFGEEAAWVRPPADAHARLVWAITSPRRLSIEIVQHVFMGQPGQLRQFLNDAARVLEAYPTACRIEISETRVQPIIESV